MKKTILVTGGAGFIGSNVVTYLYHTYPQYKILVLDALTYAGDVRNLPVSINNITHDERLVFYYGNIRNYELVHMLVSQSDVVIHLAAETHVTRSLHDNALFFETNVLGTQTVVNAVVNHKDRLERFLHISTSEVYGTALQELMDEDHPLRPINPYAAAKAGADRLVYAYWATYHIPAIILRPFNVYGPFQHLEKVIPRFITNCLLNESLKVHGDGRSSRDYLFIKDLCVAIDLLIHADFKKVQGEIFNVASGKHRSILSIAWKIVNVMGKNDSLITHIDERPGQVLRHTGDSSKLQKVLGWKPLISWENGLKKTIEWYKAHRNRWEQQLWMRTVPVTTPYGHQELY